MFANRPAREDKSRKGFAQGVTGVGVGGGWLCPKALVWDLAQI